MRGLGKDYGARTAVGSIDLDVERGECFALLGPNGAGKTTTISMLAGVVTPTRGWIEICGIELGSDPYAAKVKVGLVPQEIALYEELSALQNLRYFGALYGLRGATLAERIDQSLEVVGLRDRTREQVKTYSGGMKRRLNIAAGLLHRPQVLILDEPTVGVDPQSRNQIFSTVRALRDAGTTIVYSTHYMEEAEALCDRVAIMDAGKVIASGTVPELVAAHTRDEVIIELGGDPAAVAEASRAACAGGATLHGGSLLHIGPSSRGLGSVIGGIEQCGAVVVRIASHQATLENAFLALTGRALRDEP
ncbi:MAG: ABC transporter ATP-binding protein [Myxococcales bacterium]|nr:ABC transporter ATP-binding protein [Myxococcales bacterium]